MSLTRPGRAGHPPAYWKKLAGVHRQGGNQAVAEEYGCSLEAAMQTVYRARLLGYIPPTRHGAATLIPTAVTDLATRLKIDPMKLWKAMERCATGTDRGHPAYRVVSWPKEKKV